MSPPPLPGALPPSSPTTIRVGTAGWSYDDWEGIVYPKGVPRDFDRLEWMARFLDVVEINATFYRPARPADASAWVRRVAAHPRFRFAAKLERIFTHEPRPASLDSEKTFKKGIAPLADADRLAALLVQYPYSFRNNADNRQRLASVLTRFGEYPLVVELRHRSWIAADILAFLAARGVCLAGIDQPQLGQPVAPSLPLTGSFFYARLHGRNTDNWFRRDAGRNERYDYLYPPEELSPWIDRLRIAADQPMEGMVITNNHYRGQAAANAVEIRSALNRSRVPAPASLVQAYPRLVDATHSLPSPGPPRLF